MNPDYVHAAGLKLCKEADTIEFKRILVLQALDKDKIYQQYNKPSLFQYVLDFWKLPEDATYILIRVARNAAGNSKLQLALKDQSLSVAKAHRIVSIANDELIDYAKSHTYKEIDREVARRHPKPAPRTKIKPIAENLYSMEMGIDEEFRVKLERAKSVMAQKISASPNEQQVLIAGLDAYLYMNDPVEKAKRSKKQNPVCAHTKGRQPFTAAQKNAVNRRDEGKCTQTDANGKRCNADRWVDMHHKIQVQDGGTNDPENLTTLCRYHHGQRHHPRAPH